jgi:hypothetical protein
MRPFPDPTLDMYFYDAATNRISKVGTQLPDLQQKMVSCSGRLYRFSMTQQSATVRTAQGYSYLLTSTRPDGTDLRTHGSLHDPGAILGVHNGSLYCVAFGELDAPRKRLYRIHPERTQAFEEIRTLPETAMECVFDAGYVYFVTEERQRSLWATMTDDAAHERPVHVLYRIRLPR